MNRKTKATLAYIIGAALGDGNLSNPNGRATRLRITCDTKYPGIISDITQAIKILLPDNKVSFIISRKKTYGDISSYSNKWNQWIPWSLGKGSKVEQSVSVPYWIIQDKKYSCACLRGLLQTDGSLYKDRGYLMINFTSIIPKLAEHVRDMILHLGFPAKIYSIRYGARHTKYTVRLSKNVQLFIKRIAFSKK